MSAVQPIHKKILAALLAKQPRKTPSGQLLLAEANGKILGGMFLCLEEEHPDLVGRVGMLRVNGALPAMIYQRLLLQARSLGARQGARWIVLECEAERVALCRSLGFRVLHEGDSTSTLVFYLGGAPSLQSLPR